MGSLARANNCLWFALTRDTLHVGAHFPFNMFMPRFIADLDLTIPVVAISSVSEKTTDSVADQVAAHAARNRELVALIDGWGTAL